MVHRIRSSTLPVLAAIITLFLSTPAMAQEQRGTVHVRAVGDEGPVDAALVRAADVSRLTDERGQATLSLQPGEQTVTVEKIGYEEATVAVLVAAGGETTVEVHLETEAEELEEIVVTSTRTDRRIEDEPLRVEVIAQEEVEEKVMMTPGDIAMMLNETSGLRVQNTSPALGGSNVRVQGLRGRYTQILSDGLPLYGGQSGSLSMLQIPPMDLAQVEVIKGAASALYGSTALGGVVNLISRRPAEDEREALLNQSTLGGTDGIAWLSDEISERWGYTFLGGLHRQGQADVDEDGWADVPGYRRLVARPRLFWNDGGGKSVFFTIGTTLEDREGGTRDGHETPAGTVHPEELRTRRMDAGVVGRFLLAGDRLLSLRGSAMAQRHDHLFGDVGERDLHSNAFAEVTYQGVAGNHSWLVGLAVQSENYNADDVEGFDFTHTTPGAFVQDEYAPAEWITLAASGRFDYHSEFGGFFNPRLSVLLRPAEDWTIRTSAGTGFFAPTPFTEETEAVGLERLLHVSDLEVERARSASLDIGRAFGELEVNATLFGSIVDDPIQARVEGDRLRLLNAEDPTRTWGGELLARWHAEPFHVTATYTHLRSTESNPEDAGDRHEVPMTPRHAAGVVAMWEAETGRVGFEVYYTGKQELEENPYRSQSRPYWLTGILVERRFRDARLFANFENLFDVRQTGFDPLTLPARAPEGRWTTDAWAPLEGRAINAGVRLEF